jgi:hypothetical protein
MWQPGWPLGPAGAGNQNSGGIGAGPDNWAMAAQQWMKNKEFMEQWQQHQYQQHLQMMASAHTTAMSTIDPTVIHNPPPPPPPPDASNSNHEMSSGCNLNTSNGSNSNDNQESTNNGDGSNYSSPSSLKKPSFVKSRFSNSPMFKAVAAASNTSNNFDMQNDTKPKPLFAAYEQFKVILTCKNFRSNVFLVLF